MTKNWHDLGDPTLANAILDGKVRSAHKFALEGKSLSKKVQS